MTRQLCCLASAGLLTLATLFGSTKASDQPGQDKYWVFIGTQTSGKGKDASKGIYRCELDVATGKLSGGELVAETTQPTFLAIHPSQRFLYAIGEFAKGPTKAGGVVAYALDAKTGKLTK